MILKIINVRSTIDGLLKKRKPADVIVGFTQRYAIYVHERTELRHRVGQAKFLEQPARELGHKVLGNLIVRTYLRYNDLEKAILVAALRLQREAQLRCPVDTSALKASAFVVLEDEYDRVASEQFDKSEEIRKREMSKRLLKKG